MKSTLVILVAGLLVCVTAFCSFYYLGTASQRQLVNEQTPELAWLKQEFNLSDAELAGVSKLHDAYQPHCKEMCRRIDEHGAKLKKLLAATNTMTPEVEAALVEAGRLRAECQRDMLQHFFEISRTMPPEQGRRYLSWISERTFLPIHGMNAEAR